MTDKLLVFFDGNWADEMRIQGFEMWKEADWNEMLQDIPADGFTAYVGSNQELEFKDVKDYLTNITIHKITDEEYQVLSKFFRYGSFGKFISYEG